ncbi:helix-turn-helix domain-containing protein [Prauserella muralis]|uniref:Transcriptional regulator n=1 Tax=Prauserella muralis TaxID=588067 RepID=A0A2V4ABW5_9PSEU|nr:helix-turn-helix domain-containing protein [Prauserella muralis]PXY16589.1 transcriptional regulator [Prauserella muralis]TWE11165.1 transcriptional regulator with XRE-family HTH domain [Prauserella muralis]
MTSEDRAESIGHHVRVARKLAGWTQRQLADRAHVSLDLVKKVEQGRIPASPAFVAAAARALRVPATELMGQPYAPSTAEDHRVHAVIPALRRELAAYRLPPADGPAPRDVDTLAAAVAQASRLRHAATLDALGAELPLLLSELRAAAHQHRGYERERVYGLLAESYAAAGQVCWKLGHADLSSLCTDRIEWAAQQSHDPLAMAAADFYRAGELIAAAEWQGCLHFLEQARHRITDEVRQAQEPAVAMHGVLHLKSGLAAARAGDAATSDDHLAEATDAARHVTAGSDHYRLAFDTDSVRIWAVGLAVERRDGTEAVKRAEGFRPAATTPRERIGHHWIDLARGQQLHGQRDRALASLLQARRISPQQTRHHPQVRETVVTLAEQDRRRTDTLAGFARWAGIRLP